MGINGVASDASLASYRIFGCTGYTSDDIIAAALIMGYNQGMNVLTLSLGGPSGWSEGTASVVASRIAAQGRVVTVAAGNSSLFHFWLAHFQTHTPQRRARRCVVHLGSRRWNRRHLSGLCRQYRLPDTECNRPRRCPQPHRAYSSYLRKRQMLNRRLAAVFHGPSSKCHWRNANLRHFDKYLAAR
jgi:hypothetical protein